MKKIGLLIVGLLLFLCGCKEEKTIEMFEASRERFYYEGTEGVNSIAVDEEGILYTIEYQMPEDIGPVLAEDFVYRPSVQVVSAYDLDGNCVVQKELEFGNGTIVNVFIDSGALYCLSARSSWEKDTVCVYEIDLSTWEVEELFEIKGIRYITRMLKVGEYIYFLGESTDETNLFEEESLDGTEYAYRKDHIYRMSTMSENSQMEMMQIDFPVDMYKTLEDTLMVYCYRKGEGLCMLEFDDKQGTLTQPQFESTGLYQELCDCEDGILCIVNREYLCYVTFDGKAAQILPEQVYTNRQLVYKKGFAFYINFEGQKCVERVCLENVVKDNRTIKMLQIESLEDEPFGCGFVMEQQVLDEQSFALKVLALDTDYDLYALSSRNSVSYNLKKNGAFYPLNEVGGVQEYLDACFLYIKELATDEEGNIWMIPVKTAISGIIYNKEFCEANGVNFETMDFAEFLEFTTLVKKENPNQADFSSYVMLEQFFGQYRAAYDSFDTEVFRNYLLQIRSIADRQENWNFSYEVQNQLLDGNIPEFYYLYEVYSRNFSDYAKVFGSSDAIGITGIPTINEEIGNVGTISFLAVNPQSDNLEATLEYISAFSKYMMNCQDSFLLADETMYTDTPFMQECYELYKNGEIFFQMEGEVFWTPVAMYLNGEGELEEVIAEVERIRKMYMGE